MSVLCIREDEAGIRKQRVLNRTLMRLPHSLRVDKAATASVGFNQTGEGWDEERSVSMHINRQARLLYTAESQSIAKNTLIGNRQAQHAGKQVLSHEIVLERKAFLGASVRI